VEHPSVLVTELVGLIRKKYDPRLRDAHLRECRPRIATVITQRYRWETSGSQKIPGERVRTDRPPALLHSVLRSVAPDHADARDVTLLAGVTAGRPWRFQLREDVVSQVVTGLPTSKHRTEAADARRDLSHRPDTRDPHREARGPEPVDIDTPVLLLVGQDEIRAMRDDASDVRVLRATDPICVRERIVR
jgi:hypothetical protein